MVSILKRHTGSLIWACNAWPLDFDHTAQTAPAYDAPYFLVALICFFLVTFFFVLTFAWAWALGANPAFCTPIFLLLFFICTPLIKF
jgi:uncharacterized protein (DUF983 family)